MRGTHREPSGSALLVVLFVALAVAAAALFLVFRARLDGAGSSPPPTPTVPRFSFELTEARSVPVQRKPPRGRLDQAVGQIHSLLDGLYVAAFIDPAGWGTGFPGALQPFADVALGRAQEDLDELTLGPAGQHLELVTPEGGELSISVLFDRQRRPAAAVAVATFTATGQLRGGGSLPIEHRGRYVLRPLEGGWAIVGYDVSGVIGEPEAQAGESPDAAPPDAGAATP